MRGIRTRGRCMVGTGKTTELWGPPNCRFFVIANNVTFPIMCDIPLTRDVTISVLCFNA